MEPTLDYVSVGAPYAPLDMRARRVARVVLACGYVALWLLFAGWMGGLAGGWLGHTLFPDQPLGDDAPFVIGTIVNLLVAGTVAWMGRRARWFHVATIAVGVLGAAASIVAVARLALERKWLWEIVAVFFGVTAVAFAFLALAGVTGLVLRRVLNEATPR